MKKLYRTLMIFAAATLLLSACGAAPTEPVVAAGTAQPQGVVAEGRLTPVRSLEQSFSVPGEVAEVLVQDGETVVSGQALARLNDSPEAQAALARARQEALAAGQAMDEMRASAESALAQSRLAYLAAREAADRARDRFEANASEENRAGLAAAEAAQKMAADALEKLEKGKGIDPDRWAAAEARLGAAEAAVASAQSLIDALTLKAAMAGTIVDLDLKVGEQVAAGVPLLTIADLSGWVAQTENLTELDVVSIQTGQKATVKLDALPDLTLHGEVVHVNARFEEKRGDITYTATIRLEQSDPRMRWGMTAAIYFEP